MQSGSSQSFGFSSLQRSSLIGREQDIAMLTNLLQRDSIRLITLIGPQGAGKTSLGLQVAQELGHLFQDGIAYIMLENLNKPDMILAAIQETLHLQSTPQANFEALIAALKSKHILLVLDTFDQQVEHTQLIRDLLEVTDNLKILLTNQEPLGIKGEYEYKVFPLAIPDVGQIASAEQLEDYSATRLFIERARAKNPDFAINAENSLAVVEICTHLEGLPLAIELVAAQVRYFELQTLWQDLKPHLDFHTPGSRDRSIKQQTLQATIAWVMSLLTPEQQALLPQLALFQSGCNAEACQVICVLPDGTEATEALLLDLVERQILQQETTNTTRPRYYMLETIRSYALTQFGDAQDLQTTYERFVDYYRKLAEASQEGLNGSDQGLWLARLREEHNNFRAAIQWALTSQNPEVALKICSALWRFWLMRSLIGEGRHWFELALNQDLRNVTPTVKAMALNHLGSLYSIQGDYAYAVNLFQESLALQQAHHNLRGAASTLNNLGMASYQQGSYEQARGFFERSLDIYRELEDLRQIATILVNLGLMSNEIGDYQHAQHVLEESLALWKTLNDQWGMAAAMINLGEALEHQGMIEEARDVLEEGLELVVDLGDNDLTAATRTTLGRVLIKAQATQEASVQLAESLIQLQESGNKLAIADAFIVCAILFIELEQYEVATQTLATTVAIRESIGAPVPPSQQALYDQLIEASQHALSEKVHTTAWEKGVNAVEELDKMLNTISIKLQDFAERPTEA